MSSPHEVASELLTGRWRSQILHAGVKLGIIDSLGQGRRRSDEVAEELALNPQNTYRLMRALSSIDVLEEDETNSFGLTELGELFGSSHPESLRGICLWEEGRTLYSVWGHLPDIVKEGGKDGFRREFGHSVFEHLSTDADAASLFDEAMTSYSTGETNLVLEALKDLDLSQASHICDIGGGRGHLLCHLLMSHPHLRGTILELPATMTDPSEFWSNRLDLADRCVYVEGDMFKGIPSAGVYLMKHILHDWNDDECIQILRNAAKASGDAARLFVAEYVVPDSNVSDFSKLFDILMMIALTGRERSESEFAAILEASGWHHTKTWRQPANSMAVVEGSKSPS